ncbi:MAG TPA: ATP-binding protein [Cyclobacteriaceae bacterium]|nr:ATP-binding protein [Cyclobacteriaceae bacterium]
MVVLELLNDVSGRAFRLIQQYKTKEALLLTNHRLLQAVSELQEARAAEETKVLQLENDLTAQRERLGRDLHDCFGSQLTHVISRLDLLTNGDQPDYDQLMRLDDFVREMNRTLRETIWVLDQEAVTAKALGARIHSMLLKIWEDRETPVLHWQFHTDCEDLLIQPIVALQFIRIVQEGTNNALKHARATRVDVNMKFQKQALELIISDDGQGFEDRKESVGHGIANMRKRVESLKGTFELKSSTGGTRIGITAPVCP